MINETRELKVPASFESIPTITRFISEAAAAARLSEKENYHCQMATDEACTNVVEHAYKGRDDGTIVIQCMIEVGRLQIEIIDHGAPFNPESVPTPRVTSSFEDLQPGGIGLHLMRQLMDEVIFTFQDERNHLRMVKHHDPATEPLISVDGPTVSGEGVKVVTITGRVDSATSPALDDVLTELLDAGESWLVVDMEHVTYISSRGLKALVNAWKTTQATGGALALGGLQPAVYEVLDSVGFTALFDVYGTAELARKALTDRRSAQL